MRIDDLDPAARNGLFSQLAAHSPNVLWVFTADWQELVFVNDRYEDIWGRPIEALEANPDDFLAGVHPDDRATVRDAMTAISDGEDRDVTYRVNAAEDYGRWVQVHGTGIRDPGGTVAYVAGFARDITERVEQQAELERQNARLEEFTNVVSHDLRNPFNVAMGHLELAREECDSDHLDRVTMAHERMNALIEDLHALARGNGELETEPVDLHALATESWANVATGDATLEIARSMRIEADPSRLRQVFENLFRNSVEHGSPDNRDASRLDDPNQHAGPDVTLRVGPLEDGGFFVADDGPGIPEADRERVFDTGFSTDGNGSGLGLSIVADVADVHGWTVDVTVSEPGGARFEFRDVDVAD